MRVREVMSTDVQTCRPEDDLGRAARILWERDCGVAPVVDADSRVLAMLTDRDICMATFTQNRPPSQIPVSSAMSRSLSFVRQDDEISKALDVMRYAQVHRLPVIDEGGRIVGVVSINDLVQEAAYERPLRSRDLSLEDVAAAFAAIRAPRVRLDEALIPAKAEAPASARAQGLEAAAPAEPRTKVSKPEAFAKPETSKAKKA